MMLGGYDLPRGCTIKPYRNYIKQKARYSVKPVSSPVVAPCSPEVLEYKAAASTPHSGSHSV